MRWKTLEHPLSQDELALWLHLVALPGIGPIKGAKLLQRFAISELINCSPEQLSVCGWNETQIRQWLDFSPANYQSIIDWGYEKNQHILPFDHPAYPLLLRNVVGAPLILFITGCSTIIGELQLAIVGSRKPTTDGRDAAQSFTRELVQAGLVITSGLASGIDAISHQTALQFGGRTIAVQGCGLNQIYPSKHRALAHQILEQGGALVSEFFPDTLPRPEHFPRRNRIISGLSVGTLVIEAAEKSGSLITARYAVEQNREVFAVPGRVNNHNARGCHRLIQQGAKLVCDAADIIEEIGIIPPAIVEQSVAKPQQEESLSDLPFSRLLDNLRSNEVTAIDVIAATSGLPVQEVMTELITLELEGLILSVPGGYVRTRSA
ncbi:DNA-processing protein DprA [uncultured Tolumonas sp.]|uniref:DNA-processing protein DprA n=1 Tax=uncultured Tolumonas sp. TaxID=263765 RepID=UPI002A0A2004|nr:DNA-processing protein DprA [uncultured Tolumonas sp.]